MKKLSMIVTCIIVLAIVGSAFAFKAKQGNFCISTNNDSTNNCTDILEDMKRTPFDGTQYKYYPNWDGNGVACTAANNGNCTVVARFTWD